MTEKEVITELKKEGAEQLKQDLKKRGVDFSMDPDVEKRLRKAKATDEVIQAATAATPKEKAAAAKAAAMASGQVVVPAEETADLKALQTELDPDKGIALAEAYVKKFPQSPVLTYVYAYEAHSYQMKNDAIKVVEYAEKSLGLKKDNLDSLMTAASVIPMAQFLHEHQSDQEQQLDKAEAYCREALKGIDQLKKPPTMDDAQFASRKASAIAGVHASLGLIHYDRASLGLMGWDKDELAKAEKEYQLAVTLTDRPDPSDYYRMGAVYTQEGKLDDAIAAFTKASELGQGLVKQLADQQIELVKKAKAQSGAPAKP
jgi:tetratricopeptide (TPR) repeat protein